MVDQKRSLEEEVSKLKRDSIMQRAKLIEERDSLKKEIERLKKFDPNGPGDSMQSPAKPMVSPNKPNSLASGEKLEDKDKETLIKEIENVRRMSIIERGKLVEEKNKLKKELEQYTKGRQTGDRSSILNESCLKENQEVNSFAKFNKS